MPGITRMFPHAAVLVLLATVSIRPAIAESLPTDDGYRGIWYMNQPSNDEYHYKYSGGLATYPQQHVPIAVYAPEVQKTFFVYGGTLKDKRELLHMVSYYDHKTGTVPRPRVLLNKQTSDAHDNPTLQIDGDGHLWIFSSAHGTSRPSYIHRSTEPYSIDEFEHILETNFSYTQPWHLPTHGFLFLHTRYSQGRGLFWMTSRDGRDWSEPSPLAKIEMGDYQVSWADGDRVGTAFDYHPRPENGPYLWHTARWTGSEWTIRPAMTSDHNYDHGSFYIEDDGTWRLIAPTDAGPQPFGTGGDMVLWTSDDEGTTWNRARTMTAGGPRNHTYARRPVNAHPDFYALWADGDAFGPSESRIYFADKEGTVRVLPATMEEDTATPEVVPAGE